MARLELSNPIPVRLLKEDFNKLNILSEKTGTPKSLIIRQAVRKLLAE